MFSSDGCAYAVPPAPAVNGRMNSFTPDHPDVPEAAAELLRVLQKVRLGRERAQLPGEIRPAPHQPRPIHVDQRVGDVQVLGDELAEERFVCQAEALMQVVHVAITRIPAARGQIANPLEPQRRRLRRRRP